LTPERVLGLVEGGGQESAGLREAVEVLEASIRASIS